MSLHPLTNLSHAYLYPSLLLVIAFYTFFPNGFINGLLLAKLGYINL